MYTRLQTHIHTHHTIIIHSMYVKIDVFWLICYSKQGKYRSKVTLPDTSDSSLKNPPAQLVSSSNEMSETKNFTESNGEW